MTDDHEWQARLRAMVLSGVLAAFAIGLATMKWLLEAQGRLAKVTNVALQRRI